MKTEPMDDSHAIIVGTFDTLQESLAKAGVSSKPPRQGYVIRFYREGAKQRILIAGSDLDGARYGCVTLSRMIQAGMALLPVQVDDWPDYKYRMGFSISSPASSMTLKILDEAFRAKINIVWGPGFYTTYEKMLRESTKWKEINNYARERGIHIMFGGWFDVGEAPYPEEYKGKYSTYYYPYKDIIGCHNRAYTWSNDELLQGKGRLLAMFMRETGADAFLLHPMDTGGRDNPENWNYRTGSDRKRFGDDRAMADANVINIIYREMERENPEVILCAVLYPYGPKYLQYPEVKTWMERISSLVPGQILFSLREGTRPEVEKMRQVIAPHGYHMYYEPYPWTFDFLFSCTGRFARTFYFDDKDIYWFTTGGGTRHLWPQAWAASEYAWNTQAPGWNWMPADYRDIKYADACVPYITEELLPRICTILFGEESALFMSKIYAQNLSCRLPAMLSQFSGADPRAYFQVKYHAAQKAMEWLKQAESTVQKTSDAQDNFAAARDFVRDACYLIEARYRYYVAREKLANDDYNGVQVEEEMARKALSSVSKSNHAFVKAIAEDLDIASQIKWKRQKSAYIKNRKTGVISVGLYSPGGTYKGIQAGLKDVPGWSVSTFEDIAKQVLNKYDVIIFPATREVSDETEEWKQNVKDFVERGGGVIFSHNAVGRYSLSALGVSLFPEICAGYGGRVDKENQLFKVQKHQILEDVSSSEFLEHEYSDHLWVTPGAKAEVILRDSLDKPVMVLGSHGKGRVIYTGQVFGITHNDVEREPAGEEWKLLVQMIVWAAGVQP